MSNYEPTTLEIRQARIGRETDSEVRERLIKHHEREARARQAEQQRLDAITARLEAEREAREKEEAERRRKHAEARMQERARASFLAAGGTEAEFKAAWPELRADLLKRQVLADAAGGDLGTRGA